LRIVVELDVESEPIRGTIAHGGQTAHEYLGWLGLIEAVEQLRRASAEQTEKGRRCARES
jgi:hypothetical protein